MKRRVSKTVKHLLLPSTPASATPTSRGHRYHEAAGVRFHFQSTRLLQCSSVRVTSINHRPFATSAERRYSGHTWSVTVRPCPSDTDGAALAASRSSYPVQGCPFDVYGTRVCIRSTSQQQPSTSTSSLCQQPRLHCSTDIELSLETEPALLPVRQYGTICLSLSDHRRGFISLVLGAKDVESEVDPEGY